MCVMKYILFAGFALVQFALILSSPEGAARLRYLKGYGLAIPVAFLLAVLVMLAIKLSGVYPGAQAKSLFFAVLMSVLAILLSNAMVLVGGYMVDLLLGFQKEKGAGQVDFVVRNRKAIFWVLKGIFLLATLWGLYGLWFGRK